MDNRIDAFTLCSALEGLANSFICSTGNIRLRQHDHSEVHFHVGRWYIRSLPLRVMSSWLPSTQQPAPDISIIARHLWAPTHLKHVLISRVPRNQIRRIGVTKSRWT